MVGKDSPRTRQHPTFLPGLALALTLAVPAAAAGPDRAGVEFFERKVRPVLVQHCYQCHSAQSRSVKGGLRLDSREGLLKGGDSGPAVVPGKAEESPLLTAIRYTDAARRMPPRNRLPESVVADVEKWIGMGAPDPRASSDGTTETANREAGKHWAFRPVRAAPPPAVKKDSWPRTPVGRG
jgi:hypothetical protein